MLKNKKNMMVVWVLLVIAFIGFLVMFTINNKNKSSVKEENTNIMQNAGTEGVKITVLKEGSGDVAESGNMVAVAYTGMLADGTVFDSNTDPKFNHVEPFIFTLGSGQVIKGWDIGVTGMKVGEQRRLDISPELAYGANEIPGAIPANSSLTFIVELIAVQK